MDTLVFRSICTGPPTCGIYVHFSRHVCYNSKGMLLYPRQRIIKKLEIHYTPKHGSWLDIAEVELNVMIRQCFPRRIVEIGLLRSELSAWEVEQNTLTAKANWHFRTSDARIKLSLLYPIFTIVS